MSYGPGGDSASDSESLAVGPSRLGACKAGYRDCRYMIRGQWTPGSWRGRSGSVPGRCCHSGPGNSGGFRRGPAGPGFRAKPPGQVEFCEMDEPSVDSQDPNPPTNPRGALSRSYAAYAPPYHSLVEYKAQIAGLDTDAPRNEPTVVPEFVGDALIEPQISTSQEVQSGIDCESGVIGPGEAKFPLIYIKKSIADTQRSFEVEKGYWKISRYNIIVTDLETKLFSSFTSVIKKEEFPLISISN